MEECRNTIGIVLVAKLFVHPGREVEFRQFETQATQIMQKYGGCIERFIRPIRVALGEVLPHEIHLVSFPNRAQFESYRGDTPISLSLDPYDKLPLPKPRSRLAKRVSRTSKISYEKIFASEHQGSFDLWLRDDKPATLVVAYRFTKDYLMWFPVLHIFEETDVIPLSSSKWWSSFFFV